MFDLWKQGESACWKVIATGVDIAGFKMTSDLLVISATEYGGKYNKRGSDYAAQLIASDTAFINTVKAQYKSGATGTPENGAYGYTFALSNGDLGAALHKVSYTFEPYYNATDGKEYLRITVTDTFDFTEFKNPFTQDSFLQGVLWFANDIAYLDQKWHLIDEVKVNIEVEVPVE